jgi:hypothetical protein
MLDWARELIELGAGFVLLTPQAQPGETTWQEVMQSWPPAGGWCRTGNCCAFCLLQCWGLAVRSLHCHGQRVAASPLPKVAGATHEPGCAVAHTIALYHGTHTSSMRH